MAIRASPFGGEPAEDLQLFGADSLERRLILISLESTAAQYLALYGSPVETMPRLSDLARDAVVFENAYAVYPESIKGLFSTLGSVYPAFKTQPESYESNPCRYLSLVLADSGYRTALFHSGRFEYLGMQSVIRNRGFQTLEDAGDIGGNHNSSFGVDEPATVDRILTWIDALPGGRFLVTYLPIAGHHP
jgi:phosphoglycerol transferase MdoB-like AlkP superfamily enzyme